MMNESGRGRSSASRPEAISNPRSDEGFDRVRGYSVRKDNSGRMGP